MTSAARREYFYEIKTERFISHYITNHPGKFQWKYPFSTHSANPPPSSSVILYAENVPLIQINDQFTLESVLLSLNVFQGHQLQNPKATVCMTNIRTATWEGENLKDL